MRKKMKLFVWTDVLTDYTSGIMFALAKDAEEARKLLREKCSYIPDADLGQTPDEYDLNTPLAFYIWGGG